LNRVKVVFGRFFPDPRLGESETSAVNQFQSSLQIHTLDLVTAEVDSDDRNLRQTQLSIDQIDKRLSCSYTAPVLSRLLSEQIYKS
jgi:hypothetical protein